MRIRYSVKHLLWLTIAAGVLLGAIAGPRRFSTTAWASFGRIPNLAKVHPRFIRYELDNVSDESVAQLELGRILSPHIVGEAVRRLAKDDVTIADLGGDAGAWYRAHVTLRRINGGIEIRLRLWQRSQAGRNNYGRDTLAWKGLLALLGAYQADAFGELTQASTGQGGVKLRYCRAPRLTFSYVERNLW